MDQPTYSSNTRLNRNATVGDARPHRSRRQRMSVRLREMQDHVHVLCEEMLVLRRQKVNDDEKLRRHQSEIEALKAQQTEQQRRLHLLEEEVRKFRAVPDIIYRSVHYFLRELDHAQTNEMPRRESSSR